MKKIMLIALFVFLGISESNAQIDLGTNVETEKNDVKEIKTAKESKVDEKKEGVFSFMNFSFGKKNTDVNTDQSKTENVITRLEKQAEEGSLDAQLSLGYVYLYGENGIKPDDKKSFRYYSMAAEQNDPIALNNLGSLYYSGIGVEKDTSKAIELFTKASALGNSESSLNMAFIYLTGSGVKRDSNQSISLFAKAASTGNPTAQFMLGYAYYKGFVVDKNDKKAFDLIKSSADAGYADASYVLALMYMNGYGTTKNYGNAVKQFDKSAKQGSVEAMMVLAEILARGRIYNQNIFMAHIWFNIASFYGAAEAAELRDRVEASMKIEQVLDAQAQAEKFKETPSELTTYIRNTFGYNIKGYLD